MNAQTSKTTRIDWLSVHPNSLTLSAADHPNIVYPLEFSPCI
jgi:hypothetical protein